MFSNLEVPFPTVSIVDPTLGLRCTGPCPCDDSAMLRVAKLTGS